MLQERTHHIVPDDATDKIHFGFGILLLREEISSLSAAACASSATLLCGPFLPATPSLIIPALRARQGRQAC